MTNSKTRKTGTSPGGHGAASGAIADSHAAVADRLMRMRSAQQAVNDANGLIDETEDEQRLVPTWLQQQSASTETDMSAGGVDELFDEEVEDEEDEDEDEVDSSSSFSLQECINEFRARRIRRTSTQSRDVATNNLEDGTANVTITAPPSAIDPAIEELIKQNLSNKEQERKCKPCSNGFCYCFTSDSGDGGGAGGCWGGGGDCAATRGAHVRHARRSRKSEGTQVSNGLPTHANAVTTEKTHQSESVHIKNPQKLYTEKQQIKSKQPVLAHKTAANASVAEGLTAISRLKTTSADAPLIHIIQELHNNCVISEVRVNKHKLRQQQQQKHHHQRSRSLSAKPSPKKQYFHSEAQTRTQSPSPRNEPERCASLKYGATLPLRRPTPSAPTLNKINELESTPPPMGSYDDGVVYSSPLNTSSKSTDSARRKHKAAGRLLQKRLSHTQHIQFKPRNLTEPPPKPPRVSLGWEDKASVSTLASTSSSVREAERILDDFLRKKGVTVPGEENVKQSSGRNRKFTKFELEPNSKDLAKCEKRKSYPMTQAGDKLRSAKPLPSCPSLSDIERVVDSKRTGNYEKNIHKQVPYSEKPVKELSFGWKEPMSLETLNYDANANRKEYKSQGIQVSPQSNIGWQIPHKVNLDTVDGGVGFNLAANMDQKHTPVKTRLFSANKTKARDSQPCVLAEHLRNLSPWSQYKRRSSVTSQRRYPKSSLKTNSSTRNFLHNSKKKILRLVTPKKENKEREAIAVRKTPLRSVAVQTSCEDLRPYENSSTPQSPPGSYHSAVQTSHQSSSTPTNMRSQCVTPAPQFDFTRSVSPPKKAPRAHTQRRLNFPVSSTGEAGADTALNTALKAAATSKTYRSYHTDLDQDVTQSKMGYILSNIRAKLEASDAHAIRTFQEIERREQRNAGVDCVDTTRIHSRGRRNISPHHRRAHALEYHEPIYSEIEEDSIHISASPQFDNKTGIQHFLAEGDPGALYAKVQKTPKVHVEPTPLGKFLHDSLRNMSITTTPNDKPLPPEPDSSDVSYSSPQASLTSAFVNDNSSLLHCHSLNNIRTMEHNSPPKYNRNHNKSDLSLQRSEIFLENLCRSEIHLESGELKRLQKVDNCNVKKSSTSLPSAANVGTNTSACSSTPEDTISYEVPNEDGDDDNDAESHAAGSRVDMNEIASPHTNNQSTPKKQTFLTKLNLDEQQPLDIDASEAAGCLQPQHIILNQSSSCPTTPCQLPPLPADQQGRQHASSLNEVYNCRRLSDVLLSPSENNTKTKSNNPLSTATLSRFKRLKDALRKSLRKSKNYVRNETKRLSTSLSLRHDAGVHAAVVQQSSSGPLHNQSADDNMHSNRSSASFNLNALFALEDESAPVQVQLAKAVSICRQLPDLEISPEMVEAERLLLFSTLRRQAHEQQLSLVPVRSAQQTGQPHRYFIDSMRLPVQANASQDLFFNYFYICTFQCGGVIKSTQSVECRNYEVIFRDCAIEFDSVSGNGQAAEEPLPVQCQIFMLRLRKVSTLSLEPHKAVVKMPDVMLPSPTGSSSSNEEIVSRFRLHATFTLHAHNFAPYEYVAVVSQNSDKICLRASRNCSIPLTRHIRSTNLPADIAVTGRAEVRFPKRCYSGFLNVQDPHSQHNWNRRWCTLDGLQLSIWQDEQSQQLEQQPLYCLNLRLSMQAAPLEAAARELCARPRSFCVQCVIASKTSELDASPATAAVFFAADTQTDLSTWLQQLNVVLQLVANWMQ